MNNLKKITQTWSVDDYEVLTDDGFVDIVSLHETIPYDVYNLKLSDGKELKCADNHIVFDENFNEVFVADLKVGQGVIVVSDGGYTISNVVSVDYLGYSEEMYDLQLKEGSKRRYFTNGILSHNTELTKALGRIVFGTEDAVIRIDMSEYQQEHSQSRLIGSPPGYVGYNEGGQLTEAVRNRPYSVILLDEIEKAHPKIFDTFLQMLDEGHLTDGLGRKVNFKNTIIIMTSNVGVSKSLNFGSSVGFTSSKISDEIHRRELINKEVKKTFKPEFLNRIDDLIMFNNLTEDNIFEIVNIQLNDLRNRLFESNYVLTIGDGVQDYIKKHGYSEDFGARYMNRTLVKKLEDPITDKILAHGKPDKAEFVVSYDEVSDTLDIKVIADELIDQIPN